MQKDHESKYNIYFTLLVLVICNQPENTYFLTGGFVGLVVVLVVGSVDFVTFGFVPADLFIFELATVDVAARVSVSTPSSISIEFPISLRYSSIYSTVYVLYT